MNSNDTEVQPLQVDDNGCRLAHIFLHQWELIEKYHGIELKKDPMIPATYPVDIDSFHGQRRIKDFMWRIVEELGEAANCLKNKPWKQTQVLTDKEHFKEEIADAFHFFVELCIIIGWDANDLYLYYMRKNAVNKFRQESNY